MNKVAIKLSSEWLDKIICLKVRQHSRAGCVLKTNHDYEGPAQEKNRVQPLPQESMYFNIPKHCMSKIGV